MITITNLNQKKAERISTATSLVEKGLNSAESKEQHRNLILKTTAPQEHIDSCRVLRDSRLHQSLHQMLQVLLQ